MSYLIFQSCKLLNCNLKIKKFCSVSMHKMSQIFPPVKDIPSKDTKTASISQKLMLDYHIISPQNNGIYALLPLGLRAIEKLIKIIDIHMAKANCQKLSLPHLTSSSLWKMSGRLDSCGSEIFRLKDRNEHEFILSPTHEESITYLVGSMSLSHSNLPVRLYQITAKFRDEQRLKHGLMRGREFLMKDLYTFDKNTEDAKLTYETIVQLYIDIFKSLDIPVEKVQASVGSIGGTESHEFHILNSIGEDSIFSCTSCNLKSNSEILTEDKICPNCKGELINVKGIEIGQSFLLGTKYSEPMSAFYSTATGKELLHMGCYGIGVTRLLAAGIETLSEENHITWPTGIAPFKICIIPPKKGSKEALAFQSSYDLFNIISQIPGYEKEIIIDDRIKFTIGQRLNYAKRFGFPLIIIIGKSILEQIPRYELIHQNKTLFFDQTDLFQYLKDIS